jgi:hypothetical protein
MNKEMFDKIYLTELCYGDKAYIDSFNIYDVQSFKGRIFEYVNEYVNLDTEIEIHRIHRIHSGEQSIHNGYTHFYRIKLTNDDYLFFRDKEGKNFMCWMVTDNHIYIDPDLKTGFICTVDVHEERVKIRSKEFPYRIDKPKQKSNG